MAAAEGLLWHHHHPVPDRLDGPGARRARALPLAAAGGLRHRRRVAGGSATAHHPARHMVPSFLSHIIASLTLSIPGMILSETALSFLGLGLRPPTISWGVLLQEAQNVRTVALAPWLMIPGLFVVSDGAGLQLHGRRPARRRRPLRLGGGVRLIPRPDPGALRLRHLSCRPAPPSHRPAPPPSSRACRGIPCPDETFGLGKGSLDKLGMTEWEEARNDGLGGAGRRDACRRRAVGPPKRAHLRD